MNILLNYNYKHVILSQAYYLLKFAFYVVEKINLSFKLIYFKYILPQDIIGFLKLLFDENYIASVAVDCAQCSLILMCQENVLGTCMEKKMKYVKEYLHTFIGSFMEKKMK